MIKNASLATLLFMFIYNVSFQHIPKLSTARIALLVLLLTWWRPIYNEIKKLDKWVVFSILLINFCLAWAVIQYRFASGDSTQVSRLFHFQIYSIIGAIAFAVAYNHDHKEFLKGLSVVVFVQTIFIYYTFFSAEARSSLAALLVQGGNTSIENDLRAPGLSNSTGAVLSLIQSCGVASLLYLSLASKSTLKAICLTFCALIVAVSIVMVGRTGLYISMAAFFSYTVYMLFNQRRKILYFLATILSLYLLCYGPVQNEINNDSQIQAAVEWAFDIFLVGESASLEALQSMPVPPLTVDTFIGTGLVDDGYGGNASGHDSGYIQNYYSLGLPASVIFYIAVMILYSRFFLLNQKWILCPLIILMAVEYKEPFIMKYTLPFVMFTILMCLNFENKPRVRKIKKVSMLELRPRFIK